MQDDVRDARGDRGHRRVARIDDDELRVHPLADDALQDRRLPAVRFDCKYEWHVICVCLRLEARQIEPTYVFNMNSTRIAPTAAKITSGAFSML